jgi:hypothetical protein
MTNVGKTDKTYTVAELREIVRKKQEIIDELREISNRLDDDNSLENNREFERLLRKFFEMNAIVHTAPANMELREILRQEREQQERS